MYVRPVHSFAFVDKTFSFAVDINIVTYIVQQSAASQWNKLDGIHVDGLSAQLFGHENSVAGRSVKASSCLISRRKERCVQTAVVFQTHSDIGGEASGCDDNIFSL